MSWYTLILMVIGYLLTSLLLGNDITSRELWMIVIALIISAIWYLVELKGKKK